MKTKTKILLLCVVFLFAIALLPCNVFAGTYGDLEFQIDQYENIIRITDCKETATSVTIPSEIQGFKVTEIAYGAFSGCTKLTSVKIPSTVKEISYDAFQNCSSLTKVNIPSGIKELHGDTFYKCSRLKTISIPSSVTTIGNGTFAYCSSLTNITIPNNVTDISVNAFLGCTSLSSISIPSKVKVIEQGTFEDCTNLTTINLPNGVEKIGSSAFEGCIKLKTVKMPTNLKEIDWAAFRNCTALDTIEFPVGMERLSDRVFTGCTNLTKVVLPYTISFIVEEGPLGSLGAFNGVGSKLVVYVAKNSYAHKYAANNNLKMSFYTIPISSCSISGISNKTYTGINITQSPTVKFKNVTLKKETDYSLSYSSNKNTGKATIKVTGKGAYSGTVTKYFYIIPKKVTGIKAKAQTTTSVTMSWSKATGSTGYELYKYNSSKKIWEKVIATSKTSYRVGRLKAGTTYKFKVRAYKTINGKKYYGSYSSTISTTTKTSTPKISKITSKSQKATVQWKKVTGATGYEIYMATNKKGKYKKVKTVSSGKTVKYTRNKLTKKKTYYVKIRTYRKVGGNKVYSSYSSIKSIKVK